MKFGYVLHIDRISKNDWTINKNVFLLILSSIHAYSFSSGGQNVPKFRITFFNGQWKEFESFINLSRKMPEIHSKLYIVQCIRTCNNLRGVQGQKLREHDSEKSVTLRIGYLCTFFEITQVNFQDLFIDYWRM